MLIRIVKMEFEPLQVERFLDLFNRQKEKIRASEGCSHLELLRDQVQTNIFMTYSWWESPAHLEQYRNSELFRSTWAETKPLFNSKPQAWSVEQVHILP